MSKEEIIERGHEIVKKEAVIQDIAARYGYGINVYPIGGLGFLGNIENAKPEMGSRDFFDTEEEMRIPIFFTKRNDYEGDEWDFEDYPYDAETVYDQYDREMTVAEYEEKEEHLLAFLGEVKQVFIEVYPEEFI